MINGLVQDCSISIVNAMIDGLVQDCSISIVNAMIDGLVQDCSISIVNAMIDGLVQDCSISIANAMEILQSCTKPSRWFYVEVVPWLCCHGYSASSLNTTEPAVSTDGLGSTGTSSLATMATVEERPYRPRFTRWRETGKPSWQCSAFLIHWGRD